MRICDVAGCDRLTRSGRICRMHEGRLRRHGDPLVVKKPRGSLAERFWAKVQRGTGCWEWTGAVLNRAWPYGVIQRGQRGEGTIVASRLSWELANGPISDGLWVLHRCDNPRCVRPSHLFLGTDSDNKRDMIAKGRQPAHMRLGYTRGRAP
jgi:hypothetical protein